jgi:hypothetical protein
MPQLEELEIEEEGEGKAEVYMLRSENGTQLCNEKGKKIIHVGRGS